MEQSKYDVIAIVHRLFFDGKRKEGGVDKILKELAAEGKHILLIEHPLAGTKESTQVANESVVSVYDSAGINPLITKKWANHSNVINWLTEFLFNVYVMLFKVRGRAVLIAADPLNGLVGVALPFKFTRRYYHSVDFSDARFGNRLLNKIYYFLLLLSIHSFDLVGVVSPGMSAKFKSFGVKETKLFYIPNSPKFSEVATFEKEEKILVCASPGVLEKYEYERILEVVKCVKGNVPDVVLYIVGNLVEDPEYVAKLNSLIREANLESNVKFLGFLTGDAYTSVLQKVSIGFSFYNESVMYYMKYGDPLKTREYALYGIPSIVDGKVGSDEELVTNGAGFIVRSNQEACQKICELFENSEYYRECSEKCVAWAKRMDKTLILRELKLKLFAR